MKERGIPDPDPTHTHRQFEALIRTATNEQLKALSAKLLREIGAVQRELARRKI